MPWFPDFANAAELARRQTRAGGRQFTVRLEQVPVFALLTIPASPAATSGPYQDLVTAHRTVTRWCAAEGRTLAGPRWEIYGDWRDDPAELETEVHYLLA